LDAKLLIVQNGFSYIVISADTTRQRFTIAFDLCKDKLMNAKSESTVKHTSCFVQNYIFVLNQGTKSLEKKYSIYPIFTAA